MWGGVFLQFTVSSQGNPLRRAKKKTAYATDNVVSVFINFLLVSYVELGGNGFLFYFLRRSPQFVLTLRSCGVRCYCEALVVIAKTSLFVCVIAARFCTEISAGVAVYCIVHHTVFQPGGTLYSNQE